MAQRGRKPKQKDEQVEYVVAEVVTKEARDMKPQSYKRFKEGRDYEATTNSDMGTLLNAEIENVEASINRGGRPPIFESAIELEMSYLAYLMRLDELNQTSDMRFIPNIENFCAFLGIHKGTISEWERTNYRGFSETIKRIKTSIAGQKMQLGEAGKIAPIVLALDMNNNHGYTQKHEIITDQSNPLGETIPADEIARKYKGLPEE